MSASVLERLAQSLAATNARVVASGIGEAREMRRTADHLEKRYGDGRTPDQEIVLKVLRRFVAGEPLTLYRDIKNICYGASRPFHGTQSLIGQPDRFAHLLRIVDGTAHEPRKLKRCFQGLLATYFAVDGYDSNSPLHRQWVHLRSQLEQWLPRLANTMPYPEWLEGIVGHRNLLTAQPTERYGASVLRGDTEEFDAACAKLGIAATSWVRRRVVLSAVEAGIAETDTRFQSNLDDLIQLLRRNDMVRNEGAAKLLNRYVRQRTVTENLSLRALAIDTFGNPLIMANQQRWLDVSADAREMVANWLKGFLIERFFELLSHDGRTDKRRPRFWLKHRASIENMWFVLGQHAMSSYNEDFKKLRQTMGNQCLSLEDSSPGNNAFIMKLGRIHVVEFGEKGNATYIFGERELPFSLIGKYLRLGQLKARGHVERLTHMDGREKWESKFSDTLARYGISPDNGEQPVTQRPRTAGVARSPPRASGGVFVPDNFLEVFRQFCNERTLRYDDRAPSGRLVVYTDSSNSFISGKLGQWGFTYDRNQRRWVRNG